MGGRAAREWHPSVRSGRRRVVPPWHVSAGANSLPSGDRLGAGCGNTLPARARFKLRLSNRGLTGVCETDVRQPARLVENFGNREKPRLQQSPPLYETIVCRMEAGMPPLSPSKTGEARVSLHHVGDLSQVRSVMGVGLAPLPHRRGGRKGLSAGPRNRARHAPSNCVAREIRASGPGVAPPKARQRQDARERWANPRGAGCRWTGSGSGEVEGGWMETQ
jgi:hypothetical protein